MKNISNNKLPSNSKAADILLRNGEFREKNTATGFDLFQSLARRFIESV
jgi:hypothetical protein